ncbi:TonB-dependent receptor plug domain-containing protein [Fretibacter rubidus]|uniref:TonB-dependent receptor plug domain-containing protein n=1 Tax=Fretibacter rubidus TaxID=570162 RepID=UPI00352AC028
MFRLCLLTGTALSLFSNSAFAQEPYQDAYDEIIVTGLRAVPFDDVTSSVSVIDALDISIRNSPYIADQLRAVPGVGLSRSGAVGGLSQIRIRGAEANHTLVLVDGIEVSNPVTGETDFGLWGGVNASRIEVARGEQSAVYGSDAIGGVVSMTTGQDGLRLEAEYGRFDTKRGALNYGGEANGVRFNLGASVFDTDGVDTAGLGGEKDGSSAYALGGSLGFDISDNWAASLLGSYRISSVATDPDLNFDGALDNADRDSDSEQILLGAKLDGQTGAVSHQVRGSYNDVTLTNEADTVFTDETQGERVKLSYSPSINFGTDEIGITASALIDYEAEDYVRISTDTLFGDPNQSQSFNTLGLSGELRARLDNIALNASLRRDDNDGRFDNATTWRVGGAYNFDFGTKLRGSFGTGVKNPTFTELFGFFPGSFVGNPDLTPETSESWEIGFDHSFETVTLSATYFDAALENEIFTVFNPDFSSSPANRDSDSDRSGVEVSTNWDVTSAWSLSGALSKISSSDNNDTPEIRVPEWTGSASVLWSSPTKDGFNIGAALDYVGSQDDFNFGTFPAERVTLDSYVLLSATAAYPLTDRIALTLRGENLLDEDTRDVFGFNSTGAGVFFGFRLR